MRRKLEEILAEARSFMRSRPILTAAELDIFTRLHEAPATARELAESLELDLRAATRLLDCLVTFGFLEKEKDVYRTTERGAYLSSRHPESLLPMVMHLNLLWNNWGNLTETVRKGINPKRGSITHGSEESLTAFIGAMHVVGRYLAEEIADGYDLSPYRKLLDIGGASGTYTVAFLKRNPGMRGILFDLDRVIPMAEERFRSEGLLDRVELVAGDFHEDEIPQGVDLTLLSAIIHQNSPAENVGLYTKIHRALIPGGVLLIRDHIMDENRTDPAPGAVFAINMLVNTAGGDTYTFEEVKSHLEEAGFVDVKMVRRGDRMDCLVEGRKPGQQ